MATSSITVLVDDREPVVISNRIANFGLQVGIAHLDSGDYAMYPHGLSVGIERKTISNLLGSISTKQLVSQAHKLVATYDIPILLREGAWRCNAEKLEYHDPHHPEHDSEGWVRSGWAWSSVNGMMFDLQLMGIMIWDCPVLGNAANDIATIAHSLHKEEHGWIRERERPNVLSLSKQYRNNVWALCAFDGVGPEIAGRLLAGRSFADVIRAAEVAPLTLTEVEGFGKKRAERLNEEVTMTYG